MNNETLFAVSKSSKLYKTYNWLGNLPCQDHLRPAYAFKDLCSLIRNSLLGLVTLPMLLLFLAMCLFMFVIVPFGSLIDVLLPAVSLFPAKTLDVGLTLFTFYVLVLGTFCISVAHVKWKQKRPLNTRFGLVSKPNIYIQAIKDKHNKICRSIEIVE